MLVIIFCNGTKEIERGWHVGNDKPRIIELDPITKELINDHDPKWIVKQIQADGHELEHIQMNFENIPMVSNRRVIRWTGDFAQFIYENL